MIGRKIYYELATGDVVLITPEKHHQDAVNTTKEQDFQMYDVLQARNPAQVGMMQLEYGEMRGDFEKANAVKVDLETEELLFNFPVFEPSHSQAIQTLNQKLAEKDQQIAELQQLVADLSELLIESEVI